MEINIYNPADDAKKISGFTIVVDVFRAFSTSYYIDANKPAKYIIAESIEHAFELKGINPSPLLIGERAGYKIDGFDFGNSPSEINGRDFSANTVIHTTTAGTKGLLAQPEKNEVVVGSFINSRALLKYISENRIQTVNIYCTAEADKEYGEEDYAFAEYFRNKLLGKDGGFDEIVGKLRNGSGRVFHAGSFAPYADFLYCLDINRFDAVLKRKIVSGQSHGIELERI